jgi:hypothetical protein
VFAFLLLDLRRIHTSAEPCNGQIILNIDRVLAKIRFGVNKFSNLIVFKLRFVGSHSVLNFFLKHAEVLCFIRFRREEIVQVKTCCV